MLNLKKEAKQLESDKLQISNCPVCNSYVSHIYFMQDADSKKTSKWFSCACGVVYQDQKPTKTYDKKYWEDHEQNDKKLEASYKHPVKIYSPIIEELIYGRRVLLVGKTTVHQEAEFRRRGWVTTTLDKNPHSNPDILADFEEHKFPESRKYNLIWFNQTLECLSDPVASLNMLSNILYEDGIIVVLSPDTDFIHTRGSAGFIHWKPDMNYLMWNRQSLTRHLEKLGYNVIMARQNYEHRFPAWDDLHLIAQRKFF